MNKITIVRKLVGKEEERTLEFVYKRLQPQQKEELTKILFEIQNPSRLLNWIQFYYDNSCSSRGEDAVKFREKATESIVIKLIGLGPKVRNELLKLDYSKRSMYYDWPQWFPVLEAIYPLDSEMQLALLEVLLEYSTNLPSLRKEGGHKVLARMMSLSTRKERVDLIREVEEMDDKAFFKAFVE